MKLSCESDKGPSHRWCCSEIVPADPVRQSPPGGMEFLANRENCPSGRTAASMSVKVKLRRTHCEQMFSALLLRADIAQCSRHLRFVPTTNMADARDHPFWRAEPRSGKPQFMLKAPPKLCPLSAVAFKKLPPLNKVTCA